MEEHLQHAFSFASPKCFGKLAGMKVRRKTWLCPIVFLFLALTLRSLAASGDENWDSAFGVPGADGPVYTIVSTGNEIYFGGRFSKIGGIEAMNVAKWNGTNWAPVGGGIRGGMYPIVLALANMKRELYGRRRFL